MLIGALSAIVAIRRQIGVATGLRRAGIADPRCSVPDSASAVTDHVRRGVPATSRRQPGGQLQVKLSWLIAIWQVGDFYAAATQFTHAMMRVASRC